MCYPFSCIAHRTLGILVNSDPTEHSHRSIIQSFKLKDTCVTKRAWVKLEITPDNGNLLSPCNGSTWTLRVDEQATLPAWWEGAIGGRLQTAAFKAVTAWQKKLIAAAKAENKAGDSKELKAARKAEAAAEKIVDKLNDKIHKLELQLDDLNSALFDAEQAHEDAIRDVESAEFDVGPINYFCETYNLNP